MVCDIVMIMKNKSNCNSGSTINKSKYCNNIIKNLNKLKMGVEVNEDITNNIFSIDFSEIYRYCFSNICHNMDNYRLINYIFNPNFHRSFSFTLLPPAIFELRRYYEKLYQQTEINDFKVRIQSSEEFEKLKSKIDNLSNDKDISPSEYKSILKNWRLVNRKFGDFSLITTLAINSGPFTIANSHKKLIELFDSNTIIAPTQIDLLQNCIDSIGSNKKIFFTIYNYLKNARGYQNTKSNLIDAEHAAIIYEINDKILIEEKAYILTSSPITFKAYERYLKSDWAKNPFVKSPMYIAGRLFLENELKNTCIDKTKLFENAILLFNDIKSCNTIADYRKVIEERTKHMSESKKNEYLESISTSIIILSLPASERLLRLFEDTVRSQYQMSAMERPLCPLITDPRANESILIRDAKTVLNDLELFEERLNIARDEVYKYMSEIFKYINIDYIDKYNYNLFSQVMEPYFERSNCDYTSLGNTRDLLDNIKQFNKKLDRISVDFNNYHKATLKGIDESKTAISKLSQDQTAITESIRMEDSRFDQILGILKDIQFNISKLGLNSSNERLILNNLYNNVELLKVEAELHGKNLNEIDNVLREKDQILMERLDEVKKEWLQSLEDMIQEIPNKEERERFLEEVKRLKPSNAREIRSATADLSTIAGFALSLISYLLC